MKQSTLMTVIFALVAALLLITQQNCDGLKFNSNGNGGSYGGLSIPPGTETGVNEPLPGGGTMPPSGGNAANTFSAIAGCTVAASRSGYPAGMHEGSFIAFANLNSGVVASLRDAETSDWKSNVSIYDLQVTDISEQGAHVVYNTASFQVFRAQNSDFASRVVAGDVAVSLSCVVP